MIAVDRGAGDRARARERLLRAYHDVASSPAGKIVLEDLRHRCCADRTTVGEGDLQGCIDPYRVLLNEGARLMLLHILQHAEEGGKLGAPRETPQFAKSSTMEG